MEIDQRQKDVCPPGETEQSGHEEHILFGISEPTTECSPITGNPRV